MTGGTPPDSSRAFPPRRLASGRPPGRLAGRQTGSDDARGPERLVRGAETAAGDEEIAEVPGLKAAERDVVGLAVLQVLVGRPGSSLLPQLDRPARSGHRVLELPSGQDVLAGELIASDHPAALPDADLGCGVRDERARERRQRLQELRDGP